MSKGKLKNQNVIALFNILSTIILQGLAFFSSPYFSRILGTANYGIVSVFNTWVTVITIVFVVRMNGAIVMGITEYEEEEQAGYQSSILSLSILIFIGFSILTLVIVAIVNSSQLLFVVMMIIQGFGMFCVMFANSKFTYEFRADLNFYMSVGISVITIVLSIIMINGYDAKNNYWGRIYGMTIPYFVIGVFIAIYILLEGKEVVNYTYWKFALPLAVPMVFHGISGIILSQSDRVMLQAMQSSSVAGIYSLAYTFSNVINVCWSALNNTWVPVYYDNTKAGNISRIKKQTKNYLELFSVLCVGFMMFNPEVYKIFASEEYRSHSSIIPIFVVGFYFIFLYSFPINYEIYHKKTKVIAVGSTASAIINIILNYVLIEGWGAYGAATATLISYIIQFLFHYFAAKYVVKGTEYPFSIKAIIPYIIIVSVIGILSVVGIEWYVRWIIALFAGGFEGYRVIKRRAIF